MVLMQAFLSLRWICEHQERVLKVLAVWSKWFLFSDAYISGLRTTFLRPTSLGVVPLHKLLEEEEAGLESAVLATAPGTQAQAQSGPGEEEQGVSNTGLSDPSGEASVVADGDPGDSEELKELLALPASELERRCKLNGLSLRGGPRVMAARILSLDAADKAKAAAEAEAQARAAAQAAAAAAAALEARRGLRAGASKSTWSGWVDKSKEGGEGEDGAAAEVVTLPDKLAIPEPQLVAFGAKMQKLAPLLQSVKAKLEKSSVVLPKSKWNTDSDEEGEGEGEEDKAGRAKETLEQGHADQGVKGAGERGPQKRGESNPASLGIGYASSGDEDEEGPVKAPAAAAATVDDERRYVFVNKPGLPLCSSF